MTHYGKLFEPVDGFFKAPAKLRRGRKAATANQPISIVDGLRQIYLRPGELLFVREPCQITTVLGSCIAVTMFHVRSGFAGICHGMLPKPGSDSGDLSGDPMRFKYLSEAIPFMGARFRSLGALAHEVEVKVFGGGNVLGFDETDSSRTLVGQGNIETARRKLSAEGMQIKAASVGGDAGRKILFNTRTGEVLQKFL